MRHGERRRVLPLHQHGARGTVPHGQPAAPPFDQEPLKLVRIHQARRRDSHLWIVSWHQLLLLVKPMMQQRRKTHSTTFSGFCLQCLMTDCVFSQPPRINSYMGSTSAGAAVRQTWQLWGPRYSNSKMPEAAGPNLYSNWSGVSNSGDSARITKGWILNRWVHFAQGCRAAYLRSSKCRWRPIRCRRLWRQWGRAPGRPTTGRGSLRPRARPRWCRYPSVSRIRGIHRHLRFAGCQSQLFRALYGFFWLRFLCCPNLQWRPVKNNSLS